MKKLLLLPFSFAWLALSQGCVPLPAEPGLIPVESEPAGADVFVMGEKVGVTPLTVKQDAVFPLTYDPAKRDLYGTIILRKEGCKDYTQRVTTTVYARGLKAKLDCGQKPADAARTDRNDGSSSVEQRLQRLKELQNKGLITDEDAKATRKRILEGL